MSAHGEKKNRARPSPTVWDGVGKVQFSLCASRIVYNDGEYENEGGDERKFASRGIAALKTF